ncbi:phage minor head protein [Tuwongella immobilis]|uniref:Phage head morphogenesis domain-containing protein n=1 Tax=Tuwongella immobilis TaxID=692036 RepID=A0A6C2YS55_9BACT|nr:phage minor head protein [Tuwongella immobilis]VIP03963.1 Uncharacterized protein OS=Acinetobacter soli CIP 110264 GN=F951_01187 PE=4 SV=1: Phage_Mu_F [Tuwongella immobilis]VTS05293.1 Uncharacterized protein OS=Acinetobacter soli CIP 110264 GN=F951_01187 PE=4 SV=1: Phage_Mu_F [Tuwongella immobilis]
MPIDPRHGRRIPSGAGISRLLRAVFARQLREVRAAIAAGNPTPNLARWNSVLVDHIQPMLTLHWHQGGHDAIRRIRQAVRIRERSVSGMRLKSDPSLLASLPLDFDVFRPQVLLAIQQAALQFAASTNATSTRQIDTARQKLREELAAGLEQGEAIARLSQRVQSIFVDPVRATSIAMTEASRAMHAGQIMAAKETGIVSGKRWLASSDSCPRCQALDNQVVGLDEPFHVDSRGGPYAVIDHAPLHPHCMCTVIEVLS